MAERLRVVDVGDRDLQLLGQVGNALDDAREGGLDVARERLELGRVLDDVRLLVDARDQVGLGAGNSSMRTRWPPCTRIRSVPSGIFSMRATMPDDADPVDVVGPRCLDLGVLARDHHQHAVAARTSLTRWTERSWPTASGVIVFGKATIS